MKTMGKWYAAAAVIAVGLLGLALVLTWGPPEARALVQSAGAWIVAVLAPLVTALLTRDSDGDGKPDILDDTPHGSNPPPPGVALLVLVLALSAVTQACGGSVAQQHARVNILADIADPTYELALEGCDEARDFIVARQGSTEEADRADMDAVNLACDTIVEGFEALRGSQLTARQAIDAGLSGAAEELLRQGMAQWEHLRTLFERFMQTTSGGES